MSDPYHIVETAPRQRSGSFSRADCIAMALIALYWLDRIDVLIDEAVGRMAEAKRKEES